jgi:hypothetical protein
MRQADDMVDASGGHASGKLRGDQLQGLRAVAARSRGEGADRAGIHRVRVRVSKFGRVGEH